MKYRSVEKERNEGYYLLAYGGATHSALLLPITMVNAVATLNVLGDTVASSALSLNVIVFLFIEIPPFGLAGPFL